MQIYKDKGLVGKKDKKLLLQINKIKDLYRNFFKEKKVLFENEVIYIFLTLFYILLSLF
jgi:hypothetical protein